MAASFFASLSCGILNSAFFYHIYYIRTLPSDSIEKEVFFSENATLKKWVNMIKCLCRIQNFLLSMGKKNLYASAHICVHIHIYMCLCTYVSVHIHINCIDVQHSAWHTHIFRSLPMPKSKPNTGGLIIRTQKWQPFFYCRIIHTVRCTAICVIQYYCSPPAATSTDPLLEKLREKMIAFMRELETGPRLKYDINPKTGLMCCIQMVSPAVTQPQAYLRGMGSTISLSETRELK